MGKALARDQRRLAAIVSIDVAGYSRLMGADDSGTLAALKGHRRELIDPKIAEHGGRIVKTTGDGLLLEFPSVVDAVRCAVEVQRGMATRNAGAVPDRRLDFRIGINVGDIIIDGDDIFGDGVNVAARVEGLAEPGGICVSGVVRDQVHDKLSVAFEDLGPQQVKNILRPIDVYRVALDSEAPPGRGAWPRLTQSGRWRSRPMRRLVACVILAALGIGVWAATRTLLTPAVVAPYSSQDRRMTFALLPFEAPADDKTAVQIAAAMTDAVLVHLEGIPLFVQMAPRRSVEQALQRHTATKDVASALNVHFLLRGNVAREDSQYKLDILVVDAATDRVIGNTSTAIPSGALVLRRSNDFRRALGPLVVRAAQTEVERARSKPIEALDVRDLTQRAQIDWRAKRQTRDEKGAYMTATDLLTRALALAPDDPKALLVQAEINLCDCVNAWSSNVEEQLAIGEAALEKYLRYRPDDPGMLLLRSDLFALRGRYEESLLIADSVLKRDPENEEALGTKAYDLLKLGRAQEALLAVDAIPDRAARWADNALAAAIHYELAQYDRAAQNARAAISRMDREQLANRRMGPVSLTLVASEAHLGHKTRANAALSEFNAVVPGVQTIPAIRKWMHPAADLAGNESLFNGLRLAGISD